MAWKMPFLMDSSLILTYHRNRRMGMQVYHIFHIVLPHPAGLPECDAAPGGLKNGRKEKFSGK